MRRQFQLSQEDIEYLEAHAFEWETILENGVQWVIVHNFLIPTGYNHGSVSAAVRIDPSYPDTQIDMVYFYPHLSRKDGKAIKALSQQQLDGKIWQRWSRHRTSKNPWRPGVDNLGTHLTLVTGLLEREFERA